MIAHQASPTYAEAFEAYTSGSDEKEVLMQYLAGRFRDYSVRTLLDIGSGADKLAFELDSRVKSYLAIEHREDCVEKLREHGVNVLPGVFPKVKLRSANYDVVLMSHSMPSSYREYRPFVLAGWDAVKRGGRLIIVTYMSDDGSTWDSLLRRCYLRSQREIHNRVGMLAQWLDALPHKALSSRVTLETHVRTRHRDDMLSALAFVYGDGKEGRMHEFRNNDYVYYEIKQLRLASEYRFPFENVVFEIVKG